MQIESKILIKDTCILLDLIDIGLLEGFFMLDARVLTTGLVINEIVEPRQLAQVVPFMESQRLKIDNEGNFDLIRAINEDAKGLSIVDCSIIELAIRRGGVVISSDKSLRIEATKRGFEVRGMLWVIEMLFNEGHIDLETAIVALKEYRDRNSWSPKSEIKILLDKLESYV